MQRQKIQHSSLSTNFRQRKVNWFFLSIGSSFIYFFIFFRCQDYLFELKEEKNSLEDMELTVNQVVKNFDHAAFCEIKDCKHLFCRRRKNIMLYLQTCTCRSKCIICSAFSYTVVAHAIECNLTTCKYYGCGNCKIQLEQKKTLKKL